MANFQIVGYLDPFDLAASLRTRWGQFRQENDEGLRHLPVRGPRASAADPDDERGFVQYKAAASWPELKNLLTRVQRMGDLEFGRIWFKLYPPGYRGRWSEPFDSEYAARWSRSYLALRWNPQATLFCDREWQVLAPGWVTLVNHRAPRSATNLGEWNAVALVVDSRKKEAA